MSAARTVPSRGQGAVPKYPTPPAPRPPSEWITIPVPAIVNEATFAAVPERLAVLLQRARQRLDSSGCRHLLSGLAVCAHCGDGDSGIRARATRRKTGREYRYYRCRGSDAGRDGVATRCPNRPVSAEDVEAAVWQAGRRLLEQPEQLVAEYQRRLDELAGCERHWGQDRLSAQLDRAQTALARLVDTYAEGLITKEEFMPRLERLRQRVVRLEEQVAQQRTEQATAAEVRGVIGRLEEFAAKVQAGLATADRATQRAIIVALVRRVEVGAEHVDIVFTIGPPPPGFDHWTLQRCSHRAGLLAVLAGVPGPAGPAQPAVAACQAA